MKHDKKTAPRKPTRAPARSGDDHETDDEEAIDWTPLFKTFREAFDWALDVAADLARDFQEEVDAVERVRTFMRARLSGRAANVRIEDVLFTFGLLIGAIDRDLGTGLHGPELPPLPLHFPSAREQSPGLPRVFIAPLVRRSRPMHFSFA